MRPAMFVAVCATICACSEPDTQAVPAVVQWMDWPAEVLSITPFTVRLVVWQQGCGFGAFRPGVSADQSAVTFTPFFLIGTHGPFATHVRDTWCVGSLRRVGSEFGGGRADPHLRRRHGASGGTRSESQNRGGHRRQERRYARMCARVAGRAVPPRGSARARGSGRYDWPELRVR